MKAPDFYLNNYIADELRAAFDKEDVCISYSGDYEPETLNQVHNSCEILFVEEGEADQEMYKEKMASRVGREYMEETIGWQYFVATGGLVLVKHSDDSV